METKLDIIRKYGGVEVMKASAGSGKTFSLAREYIRLLLSNRNKYAKPHRHILAVTFTNKATAEMKSRIVQELHVLSRYPEESDYIDDLMSLCGFLSVQELQQSSEKILNQILADYSAFSVMTIDKFFQATLRAFAREIGQVSEYKVELDRKALVNEAVDRVLDSLSEENYHLLHWLSERSIEKIESGEGYRLERNMSEFADAYLSNDYRSKVKSKAIDEESAFSEDNIRTLTLICRDITRDYDDGFVEAVKLLDNYLRSFADHDNCFNSNLLKKVAEYLEYRPGQSIDFKAKTLPSIVVEPAKAFVGKYKKQYQREASIVASYIEKVLEFADAPAVLRNTAQIILAQVYVFRVADALRNSFDQILSEKNVLSIDDTNTILQDIINNSDAPFIYEKTGIKYNHFLLDEFQDTSNIQWNNFLPLLKNSISEGCYNLLVGDVKQSIYRWRDADWKILSRYIYEELPRLVDNPLETNYRSTRNIVDFNNAFYAEFARRIGVSEIYSDVQQKCAGKFGGMGCVDMKFCDSSILYSSVVDSVRDAHSRNFQYKDIAVIVRTNAQGAEVASALLESGIKVITNDSLKIGNGLSVRQVVAAMYMMDDPEDAINTFYVRDIELPDVRSRSLVDIAENLFRSLPAQQLNDETLYILAFMDLLREFVSNNGNSLHAFLQYWSKDGVRKNISSPANTDAVTVITIHQSKGLSYPYVILPVPPKNFFIKANTSIWDAPKVDRTPFEVCPQALYNVPLSQDTECTLFADSYRQEKELSLIDAINTWYVATTRPEQELDIIVPMPSSDIRKVDSADGWPELKSINEALYLYVTTVNPTSASGVYFTEVTCDEEEGTRRFIYGLHAQKLSSVRKQRRKDSLLTVARRTDLRYHNPEVTLDPRGRIRISNDSAEFFDGEEKSRRKYGILLHSILEHVKIPSDLPSAIAQAVRNGDLDLVEADQIEEMLGKAIASVSDRGWFPEDPSTVIDERELIIPGSVIGSRHNRPDRVVIRPDGVDIIDYKFGNEHKSYDFQIRSYVNYYKSMGYENVNGYLWFVEEGRIV